MASAVSPRERAAADASGFTKRRGVVVVAERDPAVLTALSEVLRHDGFRVLKAGDVMTFIDRLTDVVADDGEGERVGVVIADIRMPGIATCEALAGARDAVTRPALICTAAAEDSETLVRARRLGSLAVVAEPIDVREVLLRREEAAVPDKHSDRRGGR